MKHNSGCNVSEVLPKHTKTGGPPNRPGKRHFFYTTKFEPKYIYYKKMLMFLSIKKPVLKDYDEVAKIVKKFAEIFLK